MPIDVKEVIVDGEVCVIPKSDIAGCEFGSTLVSDAIKGISSIADLHHEIGNNNNISDLSVLIDLNDIASAWKFLSEQFIHFLSKGTVFNENEYDSQEFSHILTSYGITKEYQEPIINRFKEKGIYYRHGVK